GSVGHSLLKKDRNTGMLDRPQYIATSLYEMLTGRLKVVDPIVGFMRVQVVGTTYLYTIRIYFDQITTTRFEACYYKIDTDKECLTAWQSLQNAYQSCNISLAIPPKTRDLQRLGVLITCLPNTISNVSQIINQTTVNTTTTNVTDWWNPLALTLNDIHHGYLADVTSVSSLSLIQLIVTLLETIVNITEIINRTTIIVLIPLELENLTTVRSTVMTSSEISETSEEEQSTTAQVIETTSRSLIHATTEVDQATTAFSSITSESLFNLTGVFGDTTAGPLTMNAELISSASLEIIPTALSPIIDDGLLYSSATQQEMSVAPETFEMISLSSTSAYLLTSSRVSEQSSASVSSLASLLDEETTS
ncbi:unnamed protein product, partial [Didymodactylos carnosus]